MSSGPTQDAMREAIQAVRGISDDYQTSEQHHPNHVLIPIAKFEQLRAAEQALSTLPADLTAGRKIDGQPDAIRAALERVDAILLNGSKMLRVQIDQELFAIRENLLDLAALDSRAGDAEQRNSHDDAQVYGIGVEVDGIAIHPGRVVIRRRAEDATCDQCKGYGYLITAPSTCSEGGEKMPCPKCQMPAAMILATPAPSVNSAGDAGEGKAIERAVMDDLIREIYRQKGWTRGDKGGFPTVAARCNSAYTITADQRRNRYVATPIATPAPAVDAVPAGEVDTYSRWLAGDDTLPTLPREQYLRFQASSDRAIKNRRRTPQTVADRVEEVRRNPDDPDWDNCPACKVGALDTGYECNTCGFDAQPLVHLKDACEARGERMHPSGLYESEIAHPFHAASRTGRGANRAP